MLLELLLNGSAPNAIVLGDVDEIIGLGALVAEELFERKLPVLCLEERKAVSKSGKRNEGEVGFWVG